MKSRVLSGFLDNMVLVSPFHYWIFDTAASFMLYFFLCFHAATLPLLHHLFDFAVSFMHSDYCSKNNHFNKCIRYIGSFILTQRHIVLIFISFLIRVLFICNSQFWKYFFFYVCLTGWPLLSLNSDLFLYYCSGRVKYLPCFLRSLKPKLRRGIKTNLETLSFKGFIWLVHCNMKLWRTMPSHTIYKKQMKGLMSLSGSVPRKLPQSPVAV